MVKHFRQDIRLKESRLLQHSSSTKLVQFMQKTVHAHQAAWWRSRYLTKTLLVMKLAFILLFAALLNAHASAVSQNITFSGKNVALKKIFSVIKKQTGHVVFYNTSDLKGTIPVSVSAHNMPLDDFLEIILKNQSLSFTNEDKTIMLYHKTDGRSAPKSIIPDQHIADTSITGKVFSADGLSLGRASVTVKGGNSRTVTDEAGNFKIRAAIGETLVFTFIGFQSREILIKNNDPLIVELKPRDKELSGIVVTALGIGRQKRSLGYAVGEVKSDQMAKVPQENVVNALTGKVAGLKISNPSMDINSDPQVVIRGIKSLSGNDAPLIVVDGLPTGNDAGVLSNLSADNIESVTVLKGPSAAALYGSRAGSGVLLVTTKNGASIKKGIGVTVNSSYAASIPYHFVKQQNQFANGSNGAFDAAQTGWWGPAMGTPAIQWNSNGQAVPLKAYPDNVKNFTQTGNSFINDVSVRGANEKGNFSLSMTDTRANGTYPGVELKKDAISFSGSYNITKKVKVSTNINYLISGSDNFRSQSWDNYPFEDIYFMPNYININDVKNYWKVDGIQQNVWDDHFNNPWFTAYVNVNKFEKINPYGNIKFDWTITPQLSLMARIGTFSQTYTTQSQHGWSEVRNRQGSYNYASSNSQETNADFLLTYKKGFGDFSLNLSGGGNLMYQHGASSSIGGQNLVLPGLYTSGNVDKGFLNFGNSFYKKRINSLYGMASLDYKKVVYLDLTSRNDWSSTLPENNRSYFYPSASLSFIMSDILQLPSFVSLFKLRGGWAQVGKDTNPYQQSQTLVKSTWGTTTIYSLQTTMANNNLKPESIVSSEAGVDLSLFNNRLGFNITYYKVDDKDQIMSISTPATTGYTLASVNAGIVSNSGVEIVLHGVPVKTSALTWDVNFVYTRDRSKLKALPEGISVFQFWAAQNAYNQTKVGDNIGDVWGNDVVRVADGPYQGWPLLDGNGYVQREPVLKKIGNVINDFTVGFQTNVSYKRFTVSASFDWRQGGNYYSESMLRMTRDGRQESWYKGDGSSTFTGILSNNSFNGNKDQLAQEIKNNPARYNGANGLTWVGGRTEALGGFPLASTGLSNGAFFPGVRSDGNGGYIENFGGAGTKYFAADNIAGGSGYWDQGVQTWMYDASFLKLRELAVAYNFSPAMANHIKAQALSLSLFMRNLILWTKAKNNIDPESAGYFKTDPGAPYELGYDRANMAPWTAVMGLKLNVQF